ncbi:Protein of unknown function [Gryllus bimaculatus]|nr:Protein of unknown function [Gryllus bimaculatus]
MPEGPFSNCPIHCASCNKCLKITSSNINVFSLFCLVQQIMISFNLQKVINIMPNLLLIGNNNYFPPSMHVILFTDDKSAALDQLSNKLFMEFIVRWNNILVHIFNKWKLKIKCSFIDPPYLWNAQINH